MANFSRFVPTGLGWHRDLPDPRDFTLEHPEVSSLVSRLPVSDTTLPPSIDLRQDEEGIYFSPPDDQGSLNASSAFACLALVDYFQRRVLGQTLDASRLFLYQMARALEDGRGNSSISIRTTLKALRRFGAPPEEMWPYCVEQSDCQPSELKLLGFAKDFANLMYYRLDLPEQSGVEALHRVKSCLAAHLPIMFGFPVPRSLTSDGQIHFRPKFDSYRGGQAVLAVGYDDRRFAGNQGALLVRFSWGLSWGEAGYGWLPYSMVTRRHASDFWTIVSEKWLDRTELCMPRLDCLNHHAEHHQV